MRNRGIETSLNLFVCLLMAGQVIADSDTQLWNDIILKGNMPGTDEFTMYSTQKFIHDVSKFTNWNLAFVPAWKMNDWLKIGTEYMFQSIKKTNGWEDENRFSLIPTIFGQMGDYKLSSRTKFEYRILEQESKWRIRERLRFGTTIQWSDMIFKPWISDEVYYDEKAGEFNQNQLRLGVDLPITKTMWFATYLMLRHNKIGGSWVRSNVFGTGVIHTF